jgi:hypothetical protein
MSWGRTGGKEGTPKYTFGVYKLSSDALYLSMVKPNVSHIYGIRHTDGKLEYFDNQQEYNTAKNRILGQQ